MIKKNRPGFYRKKYGDLILDPVLVIQAQV